MYKFPVSCIEYLKSYDNDIFKKQIKLFRCYLLCISVIYCSSLLQSMKAENR